MGTVWAPSGHFFPSYSYVAYVPLPNIIERWYFVQLIVIILLLLFIGAAQL